MKLKFDRANVRWFGGCGIARRYDVHEHSWKFYIKPIDGFDEEHDFFSIIDWGSHFPAEVGTVLFDNY